MNKIGVARWVSILGHPFTFIVLVLLLPSWKGDAPAALQVTGFVVAVGLIPLGLFMRWRYASGRWLTVDASDPTDRPMLFFSLFVVVLISGLFFEHVDKSGILVWGSGVIAVMLGVAAAVNRWIKLSLHLAFAGFSSLILARVNLGYGLSTLLFIPLLAWSRLALLRHTLPEVIGGFALGLIGSCIILLL